MSVKAKLPVKGHRWFAATCDIATQRIEQKVLRQLRPLVAGAATGPVLEIGAGTGANFPYCTHAEEIVVTEPDPFMLRRARRRAVEVGLVIEFHQAPAEALPFATASFDTVVATLVLRTMTDQARTLAEVKRILKPSGAFRKHVNGGMATLAKIG